MWGDNFCGGIVVVSAMLLVLDAALLDRLIEGSRGILGADDDLYATSDRSPEEGLIQANDWAAGLGRFLGGPRAAWG
jgi:hypothetical protein